MDRLKERPILFSGAMVRAILDGKKTQTRRALKVQPLDVLPMLEDKAGVEWVGLMQREPEPKGTVFRCKFGKPSDRLWVRETWCCVHGVPDAGGVPHPDDFVRYRADSGPGEQVITDIRCWHPSIHMPRVYSRILLEIVGVRVERLNDISEADARAEGITDGGCLNCGNSEPCGCDTPAPDARDSFVRLWESINGDGSWATNPWVWVLEFRRVS